MSKGKKTTLIIALVCVVLGLILSFGVLASIQFDFTRLNTIQYETNTYSVEQPFSHLRVEGAECDIRLVPAQGSACRVICAEAEQVSHTVEVRDGTLTVIRQDQRKWYEQFGFHWGRMEITVELPQQTYDSLYLKTLSGDISVPEGFSFSQAEVRSTSGRIGYAAATQGSLLLKTTSGDLTARGLTTENLEARSVSGDVELEQIEAETIITEAPSGGITIRSAQVRGQVSAETVSGAIKLEQLNCQSVRAHASSGDLRLTSAAAAGPMELKTVSGGIKLEHSDAERLSITSTSGDVSGTLLTGKLFTTRTTSGTVRVPGSTLDAGLCEITTTSGDIRIELLS